MRTIKKLSVYPLMALSFTADADYMARVPLEKPEGGNLPEGSIKLGNTPLEEWIELLPEYTEWVNSGVVYDCRSWLPIETTIPKNQLFIQTSNDCRQDQIRNRQKRFQNKVTLEIINFEEPTLENRVLEEQTNTRSSIGTLESWISILPTYGEWVNLADIYGCTNWSPNPNTINSGVSFIQTANNCSQDQSRNVQDREQEITTSEIRDRGIAYLEQQTLTNQTGSRNSIGTKPTIQCQYVEDYSYYVTYYGSHIYSGWYGEDVTTNSTFTRGAYVTSYDDNAYEYYHICKN